MAVVGAIEDKIAINMTLGEPLVLQTAMKFQVKLRSAGNHQADLAALDELQAKLEDCRLKSRVVLELLDLPGMTHDVSMQELTEAIDMIRKEITTSGELDQGHTHLTRTTENEDGGHRQMSNQEETQQQTQERVKHASDMGQECRRSPETPWSTSGRGTDTDPLKTRLQWAGTANMMELNSPCTYPCIGLLKEIKQAHDMSNGQGNNNKKRWRLRPEKKEIVEARKQHKKRIHQQSQGGNGVDSPWSGNGSHDRLEGKTRSQHKWKTKHRTDIITRIVQLKGRTMTKSGFKKLT
jgi:hypothetical protein